jgi:hypothetical protein
MAGGKTSNKPSLPPRADFEEIEAAVMETARGRWFLAEYARRHRAADTAAVLEALARLEAKLTASLERTVSKTIAAVQAPEPQPELAPPSPLPSPPPTEADDLRAMAEELLRGTRIFDWVGTPASEKREEEAAADFWPAATVEAAPSPPRVAAAPASLEQEPDEEEPPEDEPDIADADIDAWEAELTERSAPRQPLPRSATLPDWRAPPARSEPPPPPPPRPLASAFPDLPEIAPKPVERPRLIERLSELRQPLAAAAHPAPAPSREPKPLPPGPRVDDPTLTMTRDEKLALFS